MFPLPLRHILVACALLAFTSTAHAVQSTPPQKATAPKPAAKKEEDELGKNYPPQVKEAFLRSCVGLHTELLPSCKCMTLTFEKMVPYKEFVELSKMEDPTEDNRFLKVAGACLRAQQTEQQ